MSKLNPPKRPSLDTWVAAWVVGTTLTIGAAASCTKGRPAANRLETPAPSSVRTTGGSRNGRTRPVGRAGTRLRFGLNHDRTARKSAPRRASGRPQTHA
ncbi:MAG: hypothetical protein ACO1SV_13535 [Fimbriimonas sp.]